MAHRLAPEAEADLDEIWLYVARNSSVEIANRLVDALTTRFFLLGTYPRAGRQRDDLWPGMRMFSVGEYLVLYRAEGNDVLIDRVVHGSRDLESFLRE
jgi:toxin ParE1/3/4